MSHCNGKVALHIYEGCSIKCLGAPVNRVPSLNGSVLVWHDIHVEMADGPNKMIRVMEILQTGGCNPYLQRKYGLK